MKRSSYEIEGNLYEFDNDMLKETILLQNPNRGRGTYASFYRKVVTQNVGIAYETVKGWVKNKTNPSSLDDVKKIAEILEIPYMDLLYPTHYGIKTVDTRLQKIRFTGVNYPFSLRYEGFSNVLDMIIGKGFDPATGENVTSDFAERIIDIILPYIPEDFGLPELLGYKSQYTEDDVKRMCENMSDDELSDALNSDYVDSEGNCFYDKEYKIVIDRHKFGARLIENSTWLDEEEHKELQEIIQEAELWWDYCMVPFELLNITIKFFGHSVANFTYGRGCVNPTHDDRWKLILDILVLIAPHVEKTGLCWINAMHIDQLEGEMILAIELFKHQ